MSGGKRNRDCRKRTTGVTAPEATVRGCFLRAGLVLAFVCACGWARPATAQATPSFTAPAAYDAQPGTVPVGVVTELNNTSGYLDFAVLEQVPNGSNGDQVEIFHGKSDGTFCTNCNNVNPNPDVISLGPGVTGNAITTGQFHVSGLYDLAVATNFGIAILENKNDGSGTFSLTATYSSPSAPNGFVSLSVGQFDGKTGNYDIAAVSPTVNGAISFAVFFGDGNGNFPTSSASSVSGGYFQCSAILPGSFQGLPNANDLAILCTTLYEEEVLAYLNLGNGTFALYQTLDAGQREVGVSTGVAVGTLNSLPAIFISPPLGRLTSYQFVNFAFTTVFIGGTGFLPAPSGSLAVLYQTGAAVDFATSSSFSGVGISTFTGYTQMPGSTSISGTWNSTESLGPAGALATGFSPNLGTGTYVVVDAGAHTGGYAVTLEPFVDERSISVYLVTLNGNGTVATTANAVPVYPGSAMFTTGDFNGDGETDLAVAEGGVDFTGNTALSIYLAEPPNGILPSASSPPVPVTVNIGEYNSVEAIVAGKFRGKTLPYSDLAVFSSGQISILTSNGDGTFTAGNTYSVPGNPNYPGVLTAVDVNGDLNDDIVLTLPEHSCQGSGSASQGAVYVFVSNGDGTFQSPVFVPPPVVNPVSVAAAKFFGAGQGQNDLVFADGGEICSGTNTATTTLTAVGILQNNVPAGAPTVSSGEFSPAPILTQSSDLPAPNVSAVASADMDGNGSPDLLVSSTAGIEVLLNQGGGIFAPTPQGVVPLYPGDNPNNPTLCSGNYAGCVAYDSQLATGSFFAAGESDVAASVGGVVYIFQNLGNTGILKSPTQGFVAGPNSMGLSAAIFNASGLNNLLVGTSQGAAYLLNNGQGTATGPPQPPVIMKAFGTTSMPVVDVTSLTFTIINPNTSATLTGINFTDSFPTGLAVATPSSLNVSPSCGGSSTTTAAAGSGQVILSGLTLAANTSCIITVNVTGTPAAGATVTTPVTLTNSVTVGSDQGAGNASAASVTLIEPAPPEIYKYFGTTSIALGGVTTLNFTISNLNDSTDTGLTDIAFMDNLPLGLTVANPSNLNQPYPCGGTTTANPGSNSVSLTGGALAAGTFCEISLDVIGTQSGSWTNSVTASAYESGSAVSTSSASLTVVGPLPPAITSVTPNIGAQGQQNLQVNITGMNFAAIFTTVTIGGGTAGITVPSITVNSATSITALVNIDPSTPPGNYDVVVTVLGVPPPATLTGGFTVPVTIPTDTENITVNDQVTVTPLVANFAPPAAFFSPSTLGFASGGTQTLTVSNVGGAPLAFSSGGPVISAVSGTFKIAQILCYDGSTTFPTTLPSGGACTLTITYAPSGTPMNDGGTIVFTDNAALSSPASTGTGPNYTQTIMLSTGQTVVGQPPSGTVTPPTITENITVNDQATVTPLVLNFAPPAAFFSPSTVGFASGGTQTLTVSNVGGAPLAFSSGGPVISAVSGTFKIAQILCYDGSTTFPTTLPSGGACTLTITYSPSGTPTSDGGTIVFTDTAALSSPASTGTGPNYTQTITLSTGQTVAGQPPSGTVTIPPITENITVTDTPFSAALLTSSQISITSSGLIYRRAVGGYIASGSATIKNIGGTTLNGPFQLVFTNVKPAGATLVGAAGTYNGSPFLTTASAPILPGQTVTVLFSLTTPSPGVTFSPLSVYAGTLP